MDGWAYYRDRALSQWLMERKYSARFIRWHDSGTGLWNDADIERNGQIETVRIYF